MFAIWKLPLTNKWKTAILVLSSHEMMNHAGYFQSNALVASCILLGFVYTCNGKDKWALFFILLATFMKIYGIVGFAFFFFSKNKGKYILWTVIWSFVFAALPLLITTYDFLCQSYVDWLHALQFKAEKNVVIINNSQDISVMGMIRRIFKYPSFNSLWITVPAAFLILTQFIRIKDFGDTRYRLYLLCSVMIATVIFSTGSETPTYIIAFPAVCIWYVMQKHTKLINSIFIFALILTSFSHSDLLTPYFRNHIARPYSLKALPCFVVWLILFFQIMMRQYKNIPTDRLTEI